VIFKNYSPDSCSNWGEIKDGVPRGLILSPLLFQLYINDLTKTVNVKTEIVIFANNTSVITTGLNPINFKSSVNIVSQDILIY
jgi:hypothetical protein